MAGLWTDKGQCGAKDHCNTFNGYELSFIILREVDQYFVVAVSSGTFLTTAGCDTSPRDGVNLIISLLKLVYINLFVTV